MIKFAINHGLKYSFSLNVLIFIVSGYARRTPPRAILDIHQSHTLRLVLCLRPSSLGAYIIAYFVNPFLDLIIKFLVI